MSLPVDLDSIQWGSVVAGFVWPLARVSGLFLTAPVFGSTLIPLRIRAMLALLVTLTIMPAAPPAPPLDPLSIPALLITAEQVLIGALMGFAVQLVFAALVIAGEQISMAMGLGMAQMTDPQNGTSIPVIGQYMVIVTTLLFVSLDGHLRLIEYLAASLETLPPGEPAISPARLEPLLAWCGLLFAGALKVALPALTALLATNLLMGVITRSAPQMNIFSVGLPVTTLIGMLVLLVSVEESGNLFADILASAFDVIGGFLELP